MNIYELIDYPTADLEGMTDEAIAKITTPHLHLMLPNQPEQRELIPTEQLIAQAAGKHKRKKVPTTVVSIDTLNAMRDEMRRNQ